MIRRSFFSALLGGATVKGVAAQAPAQSFTMYLPDRIRDDFAVAEGQVSFRTQGPVRSNYVEVYRNGLLQRAGADYTGATVSNPSAYQVTFFTSPLAPLMTGDYVTLFYYR